ncbi:hypothetical protein NIES4073_77220 [Kalymmatonema gypsitolerans NIES-4073]|nr:hypothetical protein NIES4073_77220 [Scytonema sp. NIES-4073]
MRRETPHVAKAKCVGTSPLCSYKEAVSRALVRGTDSSFVLNLAPKESITFDSL